MYLAGRPSSRVCWELSRFCATAVANVSRHQEGLSCSDLLVLGADLFLATGWDFRVKSCVIGVILGKSSL